MTLAAQLGESVPIRYQLFDGTEKLGTKFPRARIYTASGTLEATLDLAHVALGLYGLAYVAPSVGRRAVQYEVYSDSGHLTSDPAYTLEAAELAVSDGSTYADEEPGAAAVLNLQLHNSASNVFPRMRLYDAAGLVVATVDATHVASGLYRAPLTAPAAGWYTAQWVVYSDSGHATPHLSYRNFAADLKVGLSLFGSRLFVGGLALRASAPVLKLASR